MSNKPISNHDTPDPWVIASPLQPNLYYLTFTLGNRVEIWSSTSLENFFVDNHPQATGQVHRSTIWQPQPDSPWSNNIWAPELHFIFGTWYIYTTAEQPGQGNASHRTIVLRCTNPTRDPLDPASWVLDGPVRGLPNDQWGIDATVFSPDPGLSPYTPEGQGGLPDEQRRWYICYSGWPLGDQSDTEQDLFIARLASPTEIVPGTLTVISRPTLPWERPENGQRGVNEGPSWLSIPSSSSGAPGWRGIVYSANGSWTPDYCLAVLTYIGSPSDDPCNPSLWRKRQNPLLMCNRAVGPPFGPGHASFVHSPNPGDERMHCVYHGTERDTDRWDNRKARVLGMDVHAFAEGHPSLVCAYAVGDVHGVLPGGQTPIPNPASGQGSGMSNNMHLNAFPAQMGQGQGYIQNQSQHPQAQQGFADGQGQWHGNTQQQNASPSAAAAGGSQQSGFEKYTAQIEKKIPPQYQGYFNKAKKFFK